MTKTIPLLLCLLIGAVAVAPASASARSNVRVGIGDQQEAMFANPHFQALKIRTVRYFIPWNAMRDRDERLRARRYVLAARRSKAKVFLHVHTDNIQARKGRLPSARAYKRDVGRLVRYFKKLGVRDWGVWNEANHKTQPTYKSPRRAAQYFKAMYQVCKRCTIVALDVLDQKGVERYIARWYRALGRTYARRARIVGIHNYSDVNRKRTRGTRSIMRTVRKRNSRAKFWLTETGGVVDFGRSFPCNENRAANRLKYLFTVSKRYRRHIQRVYVYNWTGTDCTSRFDAGLVRADGSPRPGYDVVRSNLRRFRR